MRTENQNRGRKYCTVTEAEGLMWWHAFGWKLVEYHATGEVCCLSVCSYLTNCLAPSGTALSGLSDAHPPVHT